MKWILALIVTLMLAACGDNPTTSKPDAVTPGRIAMAKTGVSLAKMAAVTPDSVVQHLGTFKMSGSAFFEIQNIGGAAIENLKVTTSDSAFIMTPGTISVLETSGNNALIQILRLDVIHGTAITNGQSIERLLPYGRSTFTVYFDGITLGEPFHAEFKFSVDAIYVDVSKSERWAVIGNTIEYNGESCNIWQNDVKKAEGDSLFAYWSDGSESDKLNGSYFSTDCAVKQLLPKDLQ